MSEERVEKREVASWCLYDFGISAFNTLIVTFIFSVFFIRTIHGDEDAGTVVWTWAVNISAIVVAVTTPVLGAIADFSQRKKLFLLIATLQTAIFTAILFFMGPGMAVPAAIVFVIANVGFEGGQVFYNAFLPEISTSKTIGRISGYGWALGYIGGLLALILALILVDPSRLGLAIESPIPSEGYLNVRATILLVVGWIVIFTLPTFLVVKERGEPQEVEPGTYVREGFRRVLATFRKLRDYKEAAKLLLARLVYNDGLATIFAMGAVYAAAVFGMDEGDTIMLGIVLNVGAAVGAFGLGFVNDWIGGKWTIMITLVVLIGAGILGATAPTRTEFWIAAILISLMVGPNQSASRSLLGVFVPRKKQAEFFGFFAFSGKLASVAGPFVYGTAVASTGNHRIAMAGVVAFFVVGLVLLMFVDERAGIAAAAAESPPGPGPEPPPPPPPATATPV